MDLSENSKRERLIDDIATEMQPLCYPDTTDKWDRANEYMRVRDFIRDMSLEELESADIPALVKEYQDAQTQAHINVRLRAYCQRDSEVAAYVLAYRLVRSK